MNLAEVNPIIPGFAPDPSIVRVGDWFFLVNSSFHLFPALPIFASDDLKSWKHIGNAIDRPGQIDLFRSSTRLSPPAPETDGKTLPATAGLYAPTIRHHSGTFYIVCTNARYDKEKKSVDKENFLISTNDIWAGRWSDPVHFDFIGIDPDIFFDQDGKKYITGSATPGPWTRINTFEVDVVTGKRLSEERTIWTGTGGIYPEGPHIYKRDGWYYLLIAEGGTHITHMITMARSRNIWGPYEPCPHNPVLTAYGTNEYVQHTGHGDLFEDHNGSWWTVCLGVRKDMEGRYAMGRETFLTSVDWTSEWPIFEPVKSVPGLIRTTAESSLTSSTLSVDWVYIRNAILNRYQFAESDTTVKLIPSAVELSNRQESPTFVGKRQRRLQGKSSATVAGISEDWATTGVNCGLAYYKDEHRYFRLFFDASKSTMVFQQKNTAQEIDERKEHKLESFPSGISITMAYTEQEFKLFYTVDPSTERLPSEIAAVDTLEMTDPDFVGPLIGVFATAASDEHPVTFEAIDL
ncbi:Xylosidase/arabinosidase [Colletotrichum truncatum]|uniref:Xylosidase/arabinosidase n=1 Tax=Colletotrichum truncatum TaxID=5467 RepID=A0ACC3Z742_COLTU|nr:Xylosidase/arabinosidase [Colletotrichum truncatum]KAF6785268.1 Xylosidase/arabinosidase [Colletotrichum truncatum]